MVSKNRLNKPVRGCKTTSVKQLSKVDVADIPTTECAQNDAYPGSRTLTVSSSAHDKAKVS